MKKLILFFLSVCLMATSCEDFLERENPNAINSEFFFENESSLVLYTNGLIRSYATEIMDFINGDRYSDTQSWDGEQLFYTDRYTVANSTSWSWSSLRAINYYLEHMREAKADAAVLDHYEGVGRFFRAMFYFRRMKTFGALPWYDHVIESSNKQDLYKDRDSRSEICRHILDDLNYACAHCSDDEAYRVRATLIHRYVALAVKARFCLYEGTYRKYHTVDPSTGKPWTSEEKAEGTTYLEECINACEEIMASRVYSLVDVAGNRRTQYRAMFTAEDGCADYTDEWIWARDYDEGYQVSNKSYSINDYMINAQHASYAFNRDFIMTYLMLDGTPFTSRYAGTSYYNVSFPDECEGRDYRLEQTIRTPGFTRDKGRRNYAPDLVYAKTGYQPVKYLTDDIKDEINDATYTDVPLIRYAEILLSYAEAKAEMGACTKAIWDKTVALTRARSGVKSIYPTVADPYMQAYFENTVTDPVILEIRRERGTEFPMENLRQDDIRRWHMGNLLVKVKTGIYIPSLETPLDLDEDGVADNFVSSKVTEKAGLRVLTVNYNGSSLSGAGHVLSEGNKGYIKVATGIQQGYYWSEKKYLYPIPAPDITLNDGLGQNYGW